MKKQDEWEKSVGDQLRERRISPRPELWERVNQELDQLPVEEEEAKAFPWRWAAVFLALVGMASLYWMSQGGEEQETSLPALVEKELPREMTEPVATTPIEVIEVEQPDQAVDQREIAQAEETVPTPLEDQKRDQGLTEIAQAEQLQPSSLDQMIEEKSKALLAEVIALEKTGQIVSDQEVDSLLRLAQAELLAERQMKKGDSLYLNPLALLAEAEYELDNDKNFRDRLYDSLKDSFNRVSTAVAQRNQ